MGQFPPREPPPDRPSRRELPRPERPFDRLLKRRPERDPAPIIIGGTIAFLAIVIILVFLVSSVLGGGGGDNNGGTIDIAQGIRGRLAQIPALPPGLQAASAYIEFDIDGENEPRVIGLPLDEPATDASNLGFYSYQSSRWQRQVDVTLEQEGSVAQGEFPFIPNNLAVLRVVSQAYTAAGSIPSGATIHAEANLNIVNPRDFAPVADGSVAGEGTPLELEETIEIIPTIVGTGQEANSIVETILATEETQAQHIQSIVSLVNEGGYAGIDLEYAQVSSDYQEEFSVLVASLASELHAAGAKLSLTLPPPSEQRSAYNWEVLGQAADYIRILPIANPVVYWENMPGALDLLVEDVDPRKVMLVINPFSVETAGEVARPLGYLQAMVLAGETVIREPSNTDDIEPGTEVQLVARNLDQDEGSSSISWSDDAAALTYTIGGTDRRQIYIENAFSIAFKLELVQAYGLAGAAVSDASAESDVPDVWPTVNGFVQSATVSLTRPNESSLVPMWQAAEGDFGAGTGTSATWTAPDDPGSYTVMLVVSDGVRRFARETVVDVGEPEDDDGATPTPGVTLPPDEDTPTPTPDDDTPTPTPEAPEPSVAVEVGLLADGDGDGNFSNDEFPVVGGTITYLVTFDNDSNVPVNIQSYSDSFYGEVVCLDLTTGENVLGQVLAADDGDGDGLIDGGADEIQCTYTQTAPEDAGVVITNVFTGSVGSEDGEVGADQDDATVTTIAAPEEE